MARQMNETLQQLAQAVRETAQPGDAETQNELVGMATEMNQTLQHISQTVGTMTGNGTDLEKRKRKRVEKGKDAMTINAINNIAKFDCEYSSSTVRQFKTNFNDAVEFLGFDDEMDKIALFKSRMGENGRNWVEEVEETAKKGGKAKPETAEGWLELMTEEFYPETEAEGKYLELSDLKLDYNPVGWLRRKYAKRLLCIHGKSEHDLVTKWIASCNAVPGYMHIGEEVRRVRATKGTLTLREAQSLAAKFEQDENLSIREADPRAKIRVEAKPTNREVKVQSKRLRTQREPNEDQKRRWCAEVQRRYRAGTCFKCNGTHGPGKPCEQGHREILDLSDPNVIRPATPRNRRPGQNAGRAAEQSIIAQALEARLQRLEEDTIDDEGDLRSAGLTGRSNNARG